MSSLFLCAAELSRKSAEALYQGTTSSRALTDILIVIPSSANKRTRLRAPRGISVLLKFKTKIPRLALLRIRLVALRSG